MEKERHKKCQIEGCGITVLKKNYKRHVRDKHTEDLCRVACPQCFKTLKTEEGLRDHLRRGHGNTKEQTVWIMKTIQFQEETTPKYKVCVDKKTGEVKKEKYMQHLKEKCKVQGCGSRMIKKNVARHMREVHGKSKRAQCTVCWKVFAKRSQVRNHLIKKHHLDEGTVDKEMRQVNDDMRAKCPLCERTYKVEDWVRVHLRKDHKLDKKEVDKRMREVKEDLNSRLVRSSLDSDSEEEVETKPAKVLRLSPPPQPQPQPGAVKVEKMPLIDMETQNMTTVNIDVVESEKQQNEFPAFWHDLSGVDEMLKDKEFNKYFEERW